MPTTWTEVVDFGDRFVTIEASVGPSPNPHVFQNLFVMNATNQMASASTVYSISSVSVRKEIQKRIAATIIKPQTKGLLNFAIDAFSCCFQVLLGIY